VAASAVIPRAAGLDATTAAALWVSYSTAYGALIEKARMRPGDHVLITAATSSAGLAAIQIARQIGAIPLAVTRHSAKKAALLEAGAAAVIATDSDDLVKAAQQHTGTAGADIILDFVMGPGLADLANAAKFNGTLVSAGYLDSRPAPFPMKAPLTMYRYMSFEHTLDPTVVQRIAAFLTAGLRTGALRPAIDEVFTLDDIVAVHRYLEQGQQRPGKIVVTV
jgi:NADPH:quinone reductase